MQSKKCQSFDRVQLLFTLRASNATVFVQDRNLQYTEIYNPAPGFISDDVIGKKDEDLLLPEEAAFLTKIKQTVADNGNESITEVQITINGVPNYYNLAIKPIFDEIGEISGITCVSVNITKQKLLEMEKNESEVRFRALFYNTSEANLMLVNGICIDCNHALLTLMRCTREEIIGHRPVELSPEFQPDGSRSEDKATELIHKAVPGGSINFEWVHRRPDGSEFWAEVNRRSGMIDGKTAYFISWRNITEYKKVEEQLHQNRNVLDIILNTIPQNVFWKDRSSRYLGCNLQFARAVGLESPDKIIGKTDFDLPIPKEDAEVYIADDCFVMDNNLSKLHFIESMMHADGSRLWIDTSKMPLSDERGSVCGVLGIYEDITERKRALEELTRNRALLQAVIDHSHYFIYAKDLEGRFILASQSLADFFGQQRAQMIGKTSHDFLTRESADLHWANDQTVINSKEPLTMEETVETSFGQRTFITTKFPLFDNNGSMYLVCGASVDITERKKMTEALNKTQKLESLGLLAGGIAHDFNNLLGGIYGYMDMMNESVTDQKLHQCITKVIGTIDRGRNLTRQLLTFAKGGTPIKTVAPLFPHLNEIAQFALSGSNVSCSFIVDENLYMCDFDKSQIAQVIENIIINAKQAMPDGGKIEIEATNITVDKGQHVLLQNGKYVKISIRDHGFGMPKEILSRIFDPFYTTKSTGHGLGLATCYSIVNRHGGCIDVESEPGNGSTFHIFLPASADSSDKTQQLSKCVHKGSGNFIIMDDEEIMLEIIASMLESFGYNVIKTTDGQEAVNIFSSELAAKRTVSAMLFDLTIPGGMGGKEAINKIRKIDTRVPVFVASGYADDPVMANPKVYGFFASICKPFRKNELSEMLDKYVL